MHKFRSSEPRLPSECIVPIAACPDLPQKHQVRTRPSAGNGRSLAIQRVAQPCQPAGWTSPWLHRGHPREFLHISGLPSFPFCEGPAAVRRPSTQTRRHIPLQAFVSRCGRQVACRASLRCRGFLLCPLCARAAAEGTGSTGGRKPEEAGEPANKRARSSRQWPRLLAGSAFLPPHSPSQ